MPELRAAVRARQGITLALEQEEDGRVKATVMLSRNNELRSLFSDRSSVAHALTKAESLSLSNGFDGFYDIREPEKWSTPSRADLEGVTDEMAGINCRLTASILPQWRARWRAALARSSR